MATTAAELPTTTEQRIDRILIVDDDDGIRTQLRWGLSDRFELSIAATADEAHQAVQNERFDAVILDLGLPPDPTGPTEGLRLLEEFLSRDPTMKIVVLTGNTDHENAIRAVQLGAYDFCLKPVDFSNSVGSCNGPVASPAWIGRHSALLILPRQLRPPRRSSVRARPCSGSLTPFAALPGPM
jgi:DNA-binding NarL/FixJ family response regulator